MQNRTKFRDPHTICIKITLKINFFFFEKQNLEKNATKVICVNVYENLKDPSDYEIA